MGNGTQVADNLILGHTDTVIGNGESLCIAVKAYANLKVGIVTQQICILQRIES